MSPAATPPTAQYPHGVARTEPDAAAVPCTHPLSLDDLRSARAAWAAAAERLRGRLPELRASGVLAHWSDETYEMLGSGAPLMVEAGFDLLAGDSTSMGNVTRLMVAFGRSRARTSLPAAVHIRVAVLTRRELLDMAFDEVGDALPFTLNAVVYRELSRVLDEALIAHLTGFHEEVSVVAAENDELATRALEVADMAFAHGDADGPVIYANELFSTLFSRPNRSGPVGRPWEDVLPPTAAALLRRAREGHGCWRDLEVEDEYGTSRLLRLSLHPVGSHLQAMAIDVRDRVAYERRHAEFVQGLIHDLRTPLTLISGWSGLLATSGDELDAVTRATALETINRAGRQLQDLTDNLLELVLIESGVHAFAHDDVDLTDLARGLGEIATDIEIDAPERPVTAVADADALGRVLVNLVENARAHGSTPLVISVVDGGDDRCVHLTVADAGSCDPDVVSAALRGRVASAKGFGIGLRTSALIADALGGSLDLTSTAPTTFDLRLPARRP